MTDIELRKVTEEHYSGHLKEKLDEIARLLKCRVTQIIPEIQQLKMERDTVRMDERARIEAH